MKIKEIVITITGTIIRIAILIIAINMIISGGKKAYDFGYRIFTEEPMSEAPGRNVTVVVTNNTSEGDLAEMLEEKGVIRDALLFRIQKKLSAYKGAVNPGSYELNTSMNTDQILEVLVGPLENDESDENSDVVEISPDADNLTGLEDGGVLSEEGSYEESEAFEEDTIELIGEEETEGDEPSE